MSNNSERTVRAYLELHSLDDRIDLVVARTTHDPAQLKPSSHLIVEAITGLRAQPPKCVLVGDSATDIQAGRSASVNTIGYANRLGKHERITAAGATAIITSFADLVLLLRARPSGPYGAVS